MVLVQFVCNQGQGTVTVCIHYDVSLPQRIVSKFCLPYRHDIMLLERNYSKVLCECDSMQLYYADLIVDEQTGIVLQQLQKLTETHEVEPVVNRITKLSLQFSQCWLILYPQKGKNAG